MSKQRPFIVKLVLPQTLRAHVLKNHPPRHPNGHAFHVTLGYGAKSREEALQGLPAEIAQKIRTGKPILVTIYGRHVDDRVDSLGVMLEGAQPFRQDGKPYHITLSVADGVPPASSGLVNLDLDRPGFMLDPSRFVEFHLMATIEPSSMSKPERLDVAA